MPLRSQLTFLLCLIVINRSRKKSTQLSAVTGLHSPTGNSSCACAQQRAWSWGHHAPLTLDGLGLQLLASEQGWHL